MQNNEVNQENEEPESLLKKLINWLDSKEPGIAFMCGVLLVELIGCGFYIMLLTCSWQTMLIVSVGTVIGLIVLWGLEKLVRKICSRKKNVIELNLSNSQNLNKSLIKQINQKEISDDSSIKTEKDRNINIIENEKDQG